MAATVEGGYIYTSSNYGATWTAQTTPGTASWWGVALSSNGSQLAVSTYGGDIWTGTIAYPGITNQTVGLTANGSATVSVLNGVTGSPDSTTLAILSGPAHGNATVSSGSIIYKPNSAYAGTDSLAYQVCSSVISTVCSQATLTFDITTATVNPPDTGFGKTVRTNNIMTLLIYSTMTISLVVVGFVIRKLPQKK
jgi:hypothetical protein